MAACTKHLLFFTWHHHNWHRTVSWADTYSSTETTMWGRPATSQYVTCQTHEFCSDCGKTRAEAFCGCDKAKADQCAIHRAWSEATPARNQLSS